MCHRDKLSLTRLLPTEAVNLELVNMNGNGTKNGMGSPKKDTEVHIGDPYDEYFVPVNEHRKYMRYDYMTNTLLG